MLFLGKLCLLRLVYAPRLLVQLHVKAEDRRDESLQLGVFRVQRLDLVTTARAREGGVVHAREGRAAGEV